MIFYCYLHRLGALTPRVEVVTCETTSRLAETMKLRLVEWMPFDVIEVYNTEGDAVLCVASDDRSFRN